MTPDMIEQAVHTLAGARREVSTINRLPDGAVPTSHADGYAIQSAFIDHWDDAVVAWKIGATNAAAQALFGTADPFYGPVFSRQVALSPVNLDASAFQHFGLECEYAFRLGTDIKARPLDFARSDIEAFVDAVIPAFEIVSPRYEGVPKGDAPAAIADCGITGGLVLGDAVHDWRGVDFTGADVVLTVAGDEIARGTGAAVLGHPLDALTWLVNALGKRGIGLEAGQIISTGTCTGVNFVAQGQLCVGDFGALGQIEATFA